MRLEEVLPALREGKRIRRKAWSDWFVYACLGGHAVFYDDLIREDWEVVE